MDKQTIVPYILATLNSIELAFKLEVAITCLVTLSLLHPSSCCHHLAPCHFFNIMAFITLSLSPPSTSLCLQSTELLLGLLGQHVPPYTMSTKFRKPDCSLTSILFCGLALLLWSCICANFKRTQPSPQICFVPLPFFMLAQLLLHWPIARFTVFC